MRWGKAGRNGNAISTRAHPSHAGQPFKSGLRPAAREQRAGPTGSVTHKSLPTDVPDNVIARLIFIRFSFILRHALAGLHGLLDKLEAWNEVCASDLERSAEREWLQPLSQWAC